MKCRIFHWKGTLSVPQTVIEVIQENSKDCNFVKLSGGVKKSQKAMKEENWMEESRVLRVKRAHVTGRLREWDVWYSRRSL